MQTTRGRASRRRFLRPVAGSLREQHCRQQRKDQHAGQTDAARTSELHDFVHYSLLLAKECLNSTQRKSGTKHLAWIVYSRAATRSALGIICQTEGIASWRHTSWGFLLPIGAVPNPGVGEIGAIALSSEQDNLAVVKGNRIRATGQTRIL